MNLRFFMEKVHLLKKRVEKFPETFLEKFLEDFLRKSQIKTPGANYKNIYGEIPSKHIH